MIHSGFDPQIFRGKQVTALGVLYNFSGNDHNTTVQTVQNMVKEAWVSNTNGIAINFYQPCYTPVCGGHRR